MKVKIVLLQKYWMEKKLIIKVPLPKKGETKKAILETYTKEYSAEYQSQALIDLAKKLKD